MKKFNIKNINTPEYFDKFYHDKDIDFDNKMRQDTYLENIKEGRTIEVGCGMSPFPLMVAKLGNESWGLDFAPKTMQKMRKKISQVNYVVGDALKTPFKSAYFKNVVCGEVIEHILEPNKLLKELNRICKPGGTIVISTPNLEFDDPEHLWEFKEKDLRQMLKPYGKVKIIVKNSMLFKGRSYLFAICQKPS